MNVELVIQYGLWLLFVVFVVYRLTLSGLSSVKKIGFILLFSIITSLLFGIAKGLVFLLLAPFAVFIMPSWVTMSDKRKGKMMEGIKFSTNRNEITEDDVLEFYGQKDSGTNITFRITKAALEEHFDKENNETLDECFSRQPFFIHNLGRGVAFYEAPNKEGVFFINSEICSKYSYLL